MKAKFSSTLAAAFLLVGTIGCGAKPTRLPVAGAVTLDEQPVTNGQITFTPMADAKGPTAGSPVVGGRYAIQAERGPMAGKFRVEITALRPMAEKKQTMSIATGEMQTTSEYESLIPPRYNEDSELIAEVTADGPNEFNFKLKSE